LSKVTAIRTGKQQRTRVNIFLDGRFAFSLEAEVALKEGLQAGRELSDSQVEALVKADKFHRCLNTATRYLGYRPRSESELRERLVRRLFDSDSVEAVIAKLKKQGLINDRDFAQFWKENRQSFSPRSQRLTGLELRRKGIAEELISDVTATIDDDDCAYQAALRKARSLPRADYQAFRRRLGDFLRRRGFSYEAINQIVERVWQEGDLKVEDKGR
jgi:regulatory protein